jgi:ribosomal protein S18 acetylase RimI-like enzyme
MEIRQATLADAETLSRLARQTYADAFGHSFTPDDLAAHLAQHLAPVNVAQMIADDIVLVAEDVNDLVGYAQIGQANLAEFAVTKNDYELKRLYVRVDCQNRGIGGLLMDAALTHPHLHAPKRIFLDVWEHNLGARRFYARHGFEVVSRRRFITESGAEGDFDLIMVRTCGDRSK